MTDTRIEVLKQVLGERRRRFQRGLDTKLLDARRWERLETFLRDIVSTLSAAPVRSAGKANHRVVDAAKRLGAHLDQSNGQVLLAGTYVFSIGRLPIGAGEIRRPAFVLTP